MQVVFLELCSNRVAVLTPQNLKVLVFIYFLLFYTFFLLEAHIGNLGSNLDIRISKTLAVKRSIMETSIMHSDRHSR